MKKIFMAMMALVIALTAMPLAYAAGPDTQVDSLIEKLIEKGILTKDEGDLLKGRVAYDAKTIQETNMKKDIPEWVQNTKLTGDFRARVQSERREDGSAASAQGDRVRPRIRARLNLETKPNDKAKLVVGIATDGGGPRSGNLTLGGTTGTPNNKANVVLNKAYGQYAFNDRFTVTLGKMDNLFWEPMEFLWDSDITPEGGAVQYNQKINDKLNVFVLGAAYSLSDFNPSTSDAFMTVEQAGANVKFNDKLDSKLAFSFHNYGNIKSGFSASAARPGSATLTSPTSYINTIGPAANSLAYDYSAPTYAAEIGLNDPLPESFPLYVPRFAVFGEYTRNPSPRKNNVAWMGGAYAGNTKVNGFGTWKLTHAFKVIEKDAWLDILPDSDFYGGGTDIKGSESILEFGLAKNMSLVFDYYHARRLSSTAAKAPEHLYQADINWKF